MIKNAVITKTELGYHDGRGSIPTAWIHLNYGGAGQGFGGYTFGGAYTHKFIYGVLEALEAKSWESLPNMHCRVETDGEFGLIRRIGHILHDKWYDPQIGNE